MPASLRAFAFCLLAVMFANLALLFLSERSLEGGLQQLMHEHLASALEESLFGDDKERVNDSVSIAYIGGQINNEAAAWIKPKWFAAIEPTAVAIATIDGIAVRESEGVAAKRSYVTISLRRNARLRTVSLYYERAIRWPVFIVLSAVVAALFTAMLRYLPAPLTESQIRWARQLVTDNYDPHTAHTLVASWSDDQLDLTSRQRRIFDLLHDPSKHNFAAAHLAAKDARVASLTDLDTEWFVVSFTATGDLSVAWQMATHDDCVSIDLPNAALTIRGRNVQVTKTPLFYYAWYALKRVQDAGWMLNPPSNRPDHNQGRELAELMWKYKGHAKAISELEQHGLRAKTLDQNRSKLKEELVAKLGPAVAEHYLFDTEKDALGRVRYRLKLTAAQIKIVESKALSTELKPQRA